MTKTSSRMRALALFLAMLTLFGILPMTASASTIADGSRTCTIAPVERHFYLTTTAGTRLGASAYQYTTNDGLTGPAYCVDHGLNYSSHPLEIRGAYTASVATAAAFATSYPQHSLATFLGRYPNDTMLDGLTEEEYGYATQLAIWATLGQLAVSGTQFTSGRETIVEPVGDAQQMRIFHTIQLILHAASLWHKVDETGMYIRLCGECGSPYRRQTYMPHGEKIHVWRCLNRMDNGRRICKCSPTFAEEDIHAAVVSAMNEMFSQHTAREALKECITTALSATEPELTLPAVESKIRSLKARQIELFKLASAPGAGDSYDEEIGKINVEKVRLMQLKTELEISQQTNAAFDRRVTEIDQAVDRDSGAITEYDDVRTRQLVSMIKAMDKETILIRFKDGSELIQHIEKQKEANASCFTSRAARTATIAD